MKKILFCFIIFIQFFIYNGCASIKPTIYEPKVLKTILVWSIDFSYEPGEIEQKVKDGGSNEIKITQSGRSGKDLQLKDDIYFFLKDKHGINAVKDVKDSQGIIKINPIEFYNGGFKSVDVVLSDQNGKMLGRIRIQNGDRKATFKDDYDFAEYAADAIADALK
jgi:hypothetical protein